MSRAVTVEELMKTIDPNEIDQTLSQELNKLSFETREPINEEVHGVQCLAPDETVELLSSSLLNLSTEIEAIFVKPAYNRSQKLALLQPYAYRGAGTYINTADFRLKFLRCELFDAKKAAKRLVCFLDLLMFVFNDNDELLLRPLRISDIGESQMAVLRSGQFQLLPYRDRSGRRLLTILLNAGMNHNFVESLQAVFYLLYVAAESIESQRKGIVMLMLSCTFAGEESSFSALLPGPNDQRIAAKLNVAAPIRQSAIHMCFPDTIYHRMFRSVVMLSHMSSNATKFRIKTHIGHWTELQYQLMGFGIPVDALPISQKGTLKTAMLQQWIRLRKLMETPSGQDGASSEEDSSISASDISSAIECPNLNDVIFRMGKSCMCHPGNVMFRSLIESKLDEHYSATRKGKAKIAWWIVKEVERRGGRFLKWNSHGWWTEFENQSEVRYKIPTCFRDFSRNKTARKNRVKTNATTQHKTQQNGCIDLCATNNKEENTSLL